VLIDVERGLVDLDAVIGDEDEAAMAAITVAELRVGALLAAGRTKARRHAFIEDLVDAMPVLPYGIDVASHHAELLAAARRAGRPRGAHDLIIAATARTSGRMVVTADESGFVDLPGVEVVAHR
jgi:tRNA(fMet)-specific endonuclease VapC